MSARRTTASGSFKKGMTSALKTIRSIIVQHMKFKGSLGDAKRSCVCSHLMAEIATRDFLFNCGQRWPIDILSMTITAYSNISLIREREITSSQSSSLNSAACRKAVASVPVSENRFQGK